jgi:hypothetical protein
MSWQHIRPTKPAYLVGDRVLRFDGSNDLVEILNSTFYDFGDGDFTIGIELMLLQAMPTSTNMDFIGKRISSGSTAKVFLLGSDASTARTVRFAIANNDGTERALILKYAFASDADLLCKWITLIGLRSGGNATGNLDPNNYKLLVNGNRETGKTATNFTNANATFDTSFKINNTGITGISTFRGYVALSFCYNRGLTDEELNNINNKREFPALGCKGIWEFDHASGKTLADSSAVQQSGTLVNYTDAETGIPDPGTNRVWLKRDGIIPYFINVTNQVKQFVKSEPVVITEIRRLNGITDAAYSTDGVNYTAISFDSTNRGFVNIALPADQILYLKASTNGYAALEIIY